MFPSFNKEKSNYLACWKNVFKGKVNLEGGKSIYEEIIQMLSTQPVSVSSPAVLALLITFIYEQGEYFPATRLLAGFGIPAAEGRSWRLCFPSSMAQVSWRHGGVVSRGRLWPCSESLGCLWR